MTIDTCKVAIPVTRSQHHRILMTLKENESQPDQWARFNLSSGAISLVRICGLATTDQHSYHRDIRWDLPIDWTNDTRLFAELSLPKLYYGDNIRLLHGFDKALNLLRDFLNRAFCLKTRSHLPPIEEWELKRLDVCYCWRLPSQEHAQFFLDSLKKMRFPYKEPTIRPHSINFTSGPSSTYSFKVYLKLPEFEAHDAKEMKRARAHPATIKERLRLAEGVIRAEATLRDKWLKRHAIVKVSDLTRVMQFDFDDDLVNALKPFFNPKLVAFFLHQYHDHLHGEQYKKNVIKGNETPIPDEGIRIEAPPCEFVKGELKYQHPGGGMWLRVVDHTPTKLIENMLIKFLGEDARMGTADRVKDKLLKVYKPAIASKLMGFWLFVQRFGSDAAKDSFGRDSYYYQMRQLKEAGVSLLEQSENTIIVGKNFFTNFSMSVGNEYSGNLVDDERDSYNLLNSVHYFQGENDGASDAVS